MLVVGDDKSIRVGREEERLAPSPITPFLHLSFSNLCATVGQTARATEEREVHAKRNDAQEAAADKIIDDDDIIAEGQEVVLLLLVPSPIMSSLSSLPLLVMML